MSYSWQGGSTRAYRRVRAAVLLRDGNRCKNGISGVCTYVATCVHHTRGRGTTGDDPRYMVASCEPCNLHIGDPTKRVDPQPAPMTRW